MVVYNKYAFKNNVLFYIILKDNMKNNKTRYSVYLKNSKSCLVTRCILDNWKLSHPFFIEGVGSFNFLLFNAQT